MKGKAFLVVAALAGGCLWARAPAAPLAWRDCGSGFECAELRVPLDHARPGGPALSLAVARRRAEQPGARLGVLVTNPGGPGISAIAHLRGRAHDFSAPVRERFDLIAFDTRGTGGSAPLDCGESLDALLAADPTPESDAEWSATSAAARALADACAREHAELLPFMGTAESARDLELLRAALGEERISYLGWSYGSALGAVYASLHPERVRALVLDAPIDPTFELVAFASEQAAAVEAALGAYEREAARRGWRGRVELGAVAARAEREPIPSRGTRPARASDVLYGSVEALVEPTSGWRALDAALAGAQAGDGSKLVRLSDRYFGRAPDGRSSLRMEAQLAVLCADLRRPESADAFRAALPGLDRVSPHFGVANLVSLLPCAFWPAPARSLDPLRATPGGARLVVAGTRDPLTPHVWGVRMAQALGARRIDVDSDVHTTYGRGDAARTAPVDEFLLSPAR